MDIFHEQLVKIKPTATVIVSKIVIWIMAAVICVLSFFAMIKISPLLLFLGAAIVYFAYKTTTSFNIEFEYSVTNGVVDIDKIINKSSRKRLFTFECKQIEKIEKFNKNAYSKSQYHLCTDDLENALLFSVNCDNSKYKIVLSPNQKLMDNIKIFLPRSVIN